jgi:hypothetical protein
MRRRRAGIAISVALVVVSSGCGLLSGVGDLERSGGDAGDDGGDVEPDTPLGRAQRAIQLSSGCGEAATTTGALLSFSDQSFTVAFWLRLAVVPTDAARHPIVATGARVAADPGWFVGLEGGTLKLCTGDANGSACTPGLPAAGMVGHLVHVVALSEASTSGQSMARTMAVATLDATAGATQHSIVDSVASGGFNNWPTPRPVMVGGSTVIGGACGAFVSGDIDDVRIWNAALSAQQLDDEYAKSIACTSAGLVASYRLDEGAAGTAGNDCDTALNLALSGSYAWIRSPFP